MLATAIAGILVAIRDFVIAAALAWIGVSMERAEVNTAERACAAESCQQQAD